MKTPQLILTTTLLFIILFYDEYLGLNLGILGIAYAILTYFKTPISNKNRTFFILIATSVLSSVAFAWFGDFVSFLAVIFSLFLLAMKSKNTDLKSMLIFPIFITNAFTFIYRIFQFQEWLPKRNTKGNLQKIISIIIIPALFILIFLAIYSSGSDHFSRFFTNINFDFNFFELLGLSILGLFFAFNFWNFKVYDFNSKQNNALKNDFIDKNKIYKPTYSFLDINAERSSGIVSLIALNALLIIFIFTFNYEQFVEIPKTPNQLSAETHERVNAVIMSIIMAIVVILFYFKGNFNFDDKAKSLKILAKIWIVLNAVLVISAILKNAEYVINYGLTYKRLGVYAFLTLSIIGLIMTFFKIQKRKTNAFLFNTMTWFFYGTVLVCSFVNWGGIITNHNMKRADFALSFHKYSINFSEKQLLNFAEQTNDENLKNEILNEVKDKKEESFLSQTLFYETIKTK
jgi:hypothetical protein